MISRPKIQAFLGTYQEGAEKFPVHLQLRPGVDPSSIFLTGSSGSGKSTAGQCMAIQFAKQRTPLLALDLGHTLSPDHICPPLSSEFEALAIRHDLYNEPVATDILNPKPCGSNTESPYDTAYGLCQIIGQNIVLALLKSHRSQPRSKRLWSAGKFVPISSQAFLRH